MYDRYNRPINYLRISVTDRCNLRCSYCMPEEGIRLLKHEDILTFDEIAGFTKVAAARGISKVRITGGEPLVRKGVVILVRMIASIEGVTDLSMTTNGSLLEHFADDLRNAGLQRVNISLDTVNPDRYAITTRTGNLESVFRGIWAAKKANLIPVKINCVIRESGSEDDAAEVAEFCKSNDLEVRFIKEMDLKKGYFSAVEGGTGGDCAVCNRLRLTPNGMLKPCLFNDMEFDIRKIGYDAAIDQAVNFKPKYGRTNTNNGFYNIGG